MSGGRHGGGGRGGGRGRGHDDSDDDDRGHRRGGRGGRDGSRSQRLFDYGELRLVVLTLLAEQPRHGYEIIREIEDRTGGAYVPSPGVIYPTLAMLDELGQTMRSETGGRKLYQITDAGQAYLSLHQTACAAALAQMNAARAANSGGNAPQIARATERLQSALRQLGSKEPLTEDQVLGIADILDMAALAIERI